MNLEPTTVPSASTPSIAASIRVRAALARTPCDYRDRCLSQRVPGADAAGSVFAVLPGGTALLHAMLVDATWEPYTHAAIMDGCSAFRAPLAGYVGVVALADLPAHVNVVLADAKRTGYVEATVVGVAVQPVDFAVIILGDDEGQEIVFTFHPGDPIAPSTLPASLLAGAKMDRDVALAHGLTHAKIVPAAG